MQGAWVQSLVQELDPTCMLQLRSPRAATKSLHTATKHATMKILHAATKSLHAATKSQSFFKRKKPKAREVSLLQSFPEHLLHQRVLWIFKMGTGCETSQIYLTLELSPCCRYHQHNLISQTWKAEEHTLGTSALEEHALPTLLGDSG